MLRGGNSGYDSHGLAHQFAPVIAQPCFHGGVGQHDGSLVVRQQRSFRHALQDRRLRLERFPGAPAIGNVLGEARDPIDFPPSVAHGKGAVSNPAHRPVGPEDAVFDIIVAFGSFAGEPAADSSTIVWVESCQPGGSVATDLRAQTAPDSLVAGARVNDPVVRKLAQPEDLRDVVDDLLEAFHRLGQCGCGGHVLVGLCAQISSALFHHVAQPSGKVAGSRE